MSEADALIAAICANPDDDLPRLVYADFVEEHGATELAAFIRAQVQLAQTPPWEPFAVLCRRRRTSWVTGLPFRDALPSVDGSRVEWAHPAAFHRGFGSHVNVRSLLAWEQIAPRLLARAPICAMQLFGAQTLDDWRQFAASAVVARLRQVYFVSSPIEPLRALREQPAALGITDIHFNRASGAGMPEVVEDLLRSPLGQVVSGLHFRVGYESLHELLEAIGPAPRLQRLSFTTMGITADHLRRLADGPLLGSLSALHLANEPLGNEGVRELAKRLSERLESLVVARVGAEADGVEAIVQNEQLGNLKVLDLFGNKLTPRAARLLARARQFVGLRSLRLGSCQAGDKEVRHITRAKFWPQLVEVALDANPISRVGLRHLLDAPVPPDLTALVLDSHQLRADTGGELRKKYGERLVQVERDQ
jgi:uncharacterized protein (TIGR02996 family)